MAFQSFAAQSEEVWTLFYVSLETLSQNPVPSLVTLKVGIREGRHGLCRITHTAGNDPLLGMTLTCGSSDNSGLV